MQDYSRLHNESGSIEVTIFQSSSLILGVITIIALSLLPNVFVLAKVEKDVSSENYTTLAIDPYYINALTSKAVTLGSLGNYTGAIEYYDKALTIQPNDSYALDNKGLALDNLGNHTGAIEYYDKALAINPKYEAALDNNTFLHEVNKSFSGNNIYLRAKVTVNGFEVRSDIALTGQQQAKGLDIKNNLTERQGMLFVFQQPYRYGFWMMGMKFPIDIIWLDSNDMVTHIEHSLKPCPPANSNLVCPTYFPEKDSLYVLETVTGFSMKHNVRLGTHVSFELIK